jgi:peroxiredoxin Q/BCP
MTPVGIEPDNKAPAFTLKDQDGNQIALKGLLGQWVVLYFYPQDDTPGCTIQACEFTSGIKGFEKIGAKVYGVSPDDSASHLKFIDKHHLKIELLCDETHKVMKKYGAWGEKNMYGNIKVGVIRSTVIINPDGNIAHRWKRVKSKGHAEKVNEKLIALMG